MAARRLTPEERALWRKVAASARPLGEATASAASDAPPVSPLAPLPPPGMQRPAAPAAHGAAVRPQGAQAAGRVRLELAPDPQTSVLRPHPLMDRRRFEKLRRGRIEPEARLDLHGLSSERAHAALAGFVLAAHAAGLRLVLVITGKGREGEPEALAPHRRGVLRHAVPHWLAAPPLASKVLEVAPAHLRHGGGGAYYVYLRRAR